MDVDEIETSSNVTVASPPPKRFHPLPSPMRFRVRNPFEAALADRLHLPLIASPSLFQRPATPQLSSTQFEWTIEEVSSIKPANVEPDETQFQDSPDPEREAKAQMAISSYFKEHQIVPSPVNCSIRQQRVILAEINGNTPIGKPGRRIRDIGTQTSLTLPVDLPPALEEALRPYFQPHIAGCFSDDGNPVYNRHDSTEHSSNSSSSTHNISMRRKLFDMHNIILWDESRRTNTPKTPQATASTIFQMIQNPTPVSSITGKLSDSLDKNSSDLLSPVLGSDCLSGSPHSPFNLHATIAGGGSRNNSTSKLYGHNIDSLGKDDTGKIRRRSSLFNPPDAEELSPIYPTGHKKPKSLHRKNYASDENALLKDFVTPAKARKTSFARRRLTSAPNGNGNGNNDDDDDFDIEPDSEKFTPDRSSSPFHSSASVCSNINDHATTLATESFHVRISRLAVNSAKLNNDTGKLGITPADDTDIIPDIAEDDDAMQVSQLSLQASNLSSSSINSHCDTPTGKRRSASRKNLSQSFSANWTLDDNDENDENIDKPNTEKFATQFNGNFITNQITNDAAVESITNNLKAQLPEIVNFITEAQIGTTAPAVKQKQYDSANFYRTDSGFNEMTSSSTSNGLSLLSQQDELSREAVNFKASCTDIASRDDVIEIGVAGNEQQQKSPYCSTPSKPRNKFCLQAISATASNERSQKI